MTVEGKKIIVTGGVTGIGKASVRALVQNGAKVVSMSRKAATAENVVKLMDECNKVGPGSVCHMKCDITNQAEVFDVFNKAVSWLGGIDALVNSAGLEQQKPAEDVTREDMYGQFDVHVLGTVFTNQAVFPYFKEKHCGSIVNFSSYAGVVGMSGMPAYSAAKGAVVGFSRCIAIDWARLYGIRTNIVCPGVNTELGDSWAAEMDAERLAQIAEWLRFEIPLTGALGKAEDAANLVMFLCSDHSSFINGQTIGVDGGMMMSR